jgi:hypothetical protein
VTGQQQHQLPLCLVPMYGCGVAAGTVCKLHSPSCDCTSALCTDPAYGTLLLNMPLTACKRAASVTAVDRHAAVHVAA